MKVDRSYISYDLEHLPSFELTPRKATKRNALIITDLTDEQREAVTRIVEQLGGKVENERQTNMDTR